MSIWNYKFSDMFSAVDGNKIVPKIQHLNILFNIHAAKFKLIMFQNFFLDLTLLKIANCLISFYLNKITYFNICCYHAVINIGNY